MKRELIKEIEITEGINFEINDNLVKVTGPNGEVSKNLNSGEIKIKKKDNKLILSHKKGGKKEKKIMNTLEAHLNNLLEGVKNKFEYQLKICSGHFPISLDIQGNKAIVKNFLGEKKSREVKIPQGAEVKVDKDIITVTSCDKEIAGQASANFEHATKVSDRDPRIFQDGIYIIKKNGKEI